MDTLTPAQRSQLMSKIRSGDTKPEIKVRKVAHSLGYRFRTHRKDLPGTPDIVFPGRKKVIQVNGCFWHGHKCSMGRMPKTRVQYWECKISANKMRDKKNKRKLRSLGWAVLEIWECELKNEENLLKKLTSFLGPVMR